MPCPFKSALAPFAAFLARGWHLAMRHSSAALPTEAGTWVDWEQIEDTFGYDAETSELSRICVMINSCARDERIALCSATNLERRMLALWLARKISRPCFLLTTDWLESAAAQAVEQLDLELSQRPCVLVALDSDLTQHAARQTTSRKALAFSRLKLLSVIDGVTLVVTTPAKRSELDRVFDSILTIRVELDAISEAGFSRAIS